jgi:L-lactate dehydrogenase complex protein LldF
LCGACREVCPVKIDIPELLLHLRGEITGSERRRQEQTAITDGMLRKHRLERLAFKLFAVVMTRPRLYEWNTTGARLLQRLIMREGKIGRVGAFLSRLAPPLGAWTNGRDLRPLAQNTFREQWRDGLAEKPADTSGVKL